MKIVSLWWESLITFSHYEYFKSNLPSTSPWEELGIRAGTTRLPTLNQAKGELLGFFWFKHQDGKVDPPHSPSPYDWSPWCQPIPPSSVFLQCSFDATRLSLKTRWLGYSHGSSFCRFNNTFEIKLKYELCLFTLDFSFFHEHLLCVRSVWSQAYSLVQSPFKHHLFWKSLCCSDQRRLGPPSFVCSQTKKSSMVKRDAEWQRMASLKSWS